MGTQLFLGTSTAAEPGGATRAGGTPKGIASHAWYQLFLSPPSEQEKGHGTLADEQREEASMAVYDGRAGPTGWDADVQELPLEDVAVLHSLGGVQYFV